MISKKHMKNILLLLAFLMFACTPIVVQAEEIESLLESQLDSLALQEIDNQVQDSGQIPFRQWVERVLAGDVIFSVKDLGEAVLDMLFKELRAQLSLVKKLLFIVLLSAVLKNLNTSFSGKAVGELGFYVCYMVLITLIVSTFYGQSAMVLDVCGHMTETFLAMAPVFVTLMASSGSFGQAAVMGPVVMGGAGLLSAAISQGVLPAISLTATLEMISNITEKPMLGRFTTLLKGGISLSMKVMAFLFMALLSLQKIGSAPLNTLLGKTAKAAVGVIPVVGDVMGGAVETAAALTGALRSGFMVSAAIFLTLLCALPLLKLGAMALIYKLTAAVAEPLCEARLVKCLSAAGDFSCLLFGALFLADVMFIFSAFLLLTVF